MPRLLMGACWLALLVSCNRVPAECNSLNEELSYPLGFTSYEAAGRSVDEWRADITQELRDALVADSGLAEPLPPMLIGESFIDGVRVLEYREESRIDQELIPFLVLVPASAAGASRKQVVMVLHGHGETIEAPFDEDSEMNNIGGHLLDEGYVVVSVEMRSFGSYKVDGQGHDEYIADLDDGEFVAQVVSDNLQVADSVAELIGPQQLGTFTVFGHSFGGYIALHIGALTEPVVQAMSSGHFAPYGCINTDFHDACQDILAIDGLFEIYDSASLMAPRARVDLFYGGQDSLYTPAVDEAFARLEAIFEKLGASGEATLTVNPSLGHEVDVDAVLARLASLPAL